MVTPDSTYTIAVGRSRRDTEWHNTTVTWGKLKELLQHRRTACTLREYQQLSKEEQGRIKDVGGFVGGELKADGRRTADNIKCRTLLTLDVDHATKLPTKIAPRYALIVYSTHSHTPEAPRYRVVAPLSRPCNDIEYQAVAHRMAEGLGVDIVDMTSCEPSRLMYWAAAPKDADVFYYQQDGEPVDVDAVLATYKDYTNAAEWAGSPQGGSPRVGRPRTTPRDTSARMEDPRTKDNIVGSWCRTYDCIDVLEQMIPNLYKPAGFNRYTHIGSSSWGGLCIYDNGTFCYSYHESDPIGGQLLNAWDLYRLTHYAHLDAQAAATTRIDSLPSYTAMAEYALTIPEVKRDYLAHAKARNTADLGEVGFSFAEINTPEDNEDDPDSWLSELATDAKGNIANTLTNYALILKHDPNAIRGRVVYDEFRGEKRVVGNLPWERTDGTSWTDADTACLALYIDRTYKLRSKDYLTMMLDAVTQGNDFRRNVVQEFIERVQWDGTPRVDNLFIKYLGAEDDDYSRMITRKSLVACVARAYKPGAKYDQITVLVGSQGIGKSSILRKLAGGGDLFMDSFTMDARSNKMQEGVRGAWIIEIPELEGFYKQDMNVIKSFVSKQSDTYRPAYGREQIKVPRTCVFFATTNDGDFLRDSSGNRRFWIVQCGEPQAPLSELTPGEVAQVWAEAKIIYDSGKEQLYLSKEESEELAKRQREYDMDNDLLGELQAFLDTPLPADWDAFQKMERREYFDAVRAGVPYFRRTKYGDMQRIDGIVQRTEISAVEVLNEFFREDNGRGNVQTRKANSLLRKLGGWREGNRSRLSGGYGVQKCYERIIPRGGR
nr:virulence-associated E family protein [uncultured Porphyromonas sp.]